MSFLLYIKAVEPLYFKRLLCSALATLTLLLLWKIYIFENTTDPSSLKHHKFHFLPNESILFRCQYIYLKKLVTEDNVFMFPTEDSISMWSSLSCRFQAICGTKALSVRLAPEIKPLTSHFADQHSANLSNHKEHFYWWNGVI